MSERQVAFPRHILLKEVLRQSQENYSLEDLEKEINQSKSLIKTQAQTLILAGTNKEKEVITKQVRQGLIEQGKLSLESQPINILKPKDLDKFSLIQTNSYELGDVVKFKNNSAKFSKELYYRVDAVNNNTKTLTLRDSLGNKQSLELNCYKDRTVFQSQTRELRLCFGTIGREIQRARKCADSHRQTTI